MSCHKCGKTPTGGFINFVVDCAICGKPICSECGDWPEEGGFRCADHTPEEIKEYEETLNE